MNDVPFQGSKLALVFSIVVNCGGFVFLLKQRRVMLSGYLLPWYVGSPWLCKAALYENSSHFLRIALVGQLDTSVLHFGAVKASIAATC